MQQDRQHSWTRGRHLSHNKARQGDGPVVGERETSTAGGGRGDANLMTS